MLERNNVYTSTATLTFSLREMLLPSANSQHLRGVCIHITPQTRVLSFEFGFAFFFFLFKQPAYSMA